MRACFPVPLGLMCFIWLSMLGNAGACLWVRGTTIEGLYVTSAGRAGAEQLERASRATPEDRLEKILLERPKSEQVSAGLNDAAVEKLIHGNAKEAVQDLEAIEKAHPGDYFTAANLGTAYELSGDDQKALQWILEGIRRDPDAHMRTEWLHARILEAKIKLKSDPTWLDQNSITGLDFKRVGKSKYKLTTLQGDLDSNELHKSLWTQLSVRMLFVKPEDPIVAQLLYELALLEAQTRFLQDAKQYMYLAGTYGLSPDLGNPQIRKWNLIIGWSWLLEAAFYTAIILGPIWLMRRIKRAWANRSESGS